MKEVQKKRKFREKDEIDAYFSDVKRKSFPIGIIFFLIIIAIIGGVAYYYFVLDSSKNIYKTIIDTTLSSNKEETYEKVNLTFSVKPKLLTTKKDYQSLLEIINGISITGKASEDINAKKIYANINALYEEKDLFGLETYYENSNLYIKLNKIFDKVLKNNLTEEEINEIFNNYNIELEEQLRNSLTKNLKSTLENANYKKEYIKLNEKYVKKLTLSLDKELIEELCNKLKNDNDFLESYSKLQGITKEEVETILKDITKELDDEKITIALYLSILKNEFIMIETTSNDFRVVLTKENEEYKYKYYENDIIKYQGFIYLKEENNNYQISFSAEDIEEQLTIELNLDLSIEFNQEIEKLDTTNAIEADSLTENDTNKILENIANNETLSKLLTDIISLTQVYIEDIIPMTT